MVRKARSSAAAKEAKSPESAPSARWVRKTKGERVLWATCDSRATFSAVAPSGL